MMSGLRGMKDPVRGGGLTGSVGGGNEGKEETSFRTIMNISNKNAIFSIKGAMPARGRRFDL